MMKISAFGDEIAIDFEEQLQILQKLNIRFIDIRQAWGVTCTNFSDEQVNQINNLCERYSTKVACMGSPIGKTPLQDPIELEQERLKRIADIAHRLDTDNIRIFSFYPESDVTDQHIESAITRLSNLTQLAESLDIQLLLENEKDLVGDTPARVYQLLNTINLPRLRFIWDPANFVQCEAEEQVDNWWHKLGTYIAHIHIKDARLADGEVTPAGEGDGQVEELLRQLKASGYKGILALEPHLVEAGHSSGFSGEEGMTVAVSALRNLMSQLDIQEG